MVIRALGLFLVEISAGTSLALLFFPARLLGKGFFSLHGSIALAAAALAAALAPEAPLALRAAAVASLAACTLCSRAGFRRSGVVILAAATALQYAWLMEVARGIRPGPAVFAGAVLGSWLFGSVLVTMNLGHWYLISRELPMSLLFRAAVGYAAACALRTALLGIVAATSSTSAGWESLTSLDRDGLFFLFRILWGIVGPCALSYFIFQTSRMKANQAATGLLYVALIFVLIGELLSAYLTVRTGIPA